MYYEGQPYRIVTQFHSTGAEIRLVHAFWVEFVLQISEIDHRQAKAQQTRFYARFVCSIVTARGFVAEQRHASTV